MARSVESWCRHCHSLEHLSDSCAFKPSPLPSPVTSKKAVYASSMPSFPSKKVCRNYNFHDGECKFGATCKYQHCSVLTAMGPIPVLSVLKRGCLNQNLKKKKQCYCLLIILVGILPDLIHYNSYLFFILRSSL